MKVSVSREHREDPVSGLRVFEISGTIKWFDASRGHGFVAVDNGSGDALLHFTVLEAAGYLTAYEGARVHCQARWRQKGMLVSRIISMDESTAIFPEQRSPQTHVIVSAESEWERAMVKEFYRTRGFGFLITGEGLPDIFVHRDTLRRFGFRDLRPGQVIQVRWGHGSKGRMAAELRLDR